MIFKRKNQKGSMLVIAVIIACVLGLLSASLLSFQVNSYKQNVKTLYRTKALYLAEAGIHRAIRELNQDTDQWDGWSQNGDIYTLSITDIGDIDITADLTDGDNPVLSADGTDGGLTRTVKATAVSSGGTSSPWPGAMQALNTIDFKNNIDLDSYMNGDITQLGDRGDVSVNGDVILHNTAQIIGDVNVCGGAITNLGAGILDDKIVQYDVDGVTLIPGDYGVIDDPVMLPPITTPGDLSGLAYPSVVLGGGETVPGGVYEMSGTQVSGNLTLTGGDYKWEGDWTMKNSKDIYITGDTRIYITGTLNLKNGAEFYNTSMVGGSEVVHNVEIYCDGDMIFHQGNATNINSEYDPSAFKVYGTGESGTIDVKEGGRFSACIYAPDYTVDFRHAGVCYGAISAGTINPKNSFNLHYDERLGEEEGDSGDASFTITSWSEM